MHRASTEQMQMQMADRLAAILAGIHHRAEAVAEPFLFRDLLRHCVQVSKQPLVPGRQMRERGNVLARDQQQMHRRLRMNIREDHRIVIFIKLLRRNRTRGNLAEQTVHADQLNPARLYFEKKRGWPPARQGS